MHSTNAIVLSKLKYRDNDLIVRCYTQQHGLVSYLLRGVLKSKKGNVKPAYFQLLSQLQLVSNFMPNRSLQTIKEVKVNYVYSSLHTNVLKGAITQFLAEVLTISLKEEERNESLFSFIETTLQWLDSQKEYANFHLLFLLKLTKHLGFYPDTSTISNPYFNLMDGTFVVEKPNNYSISNENLTLLKNLLGTTFEALHSIRINTQQKQSFLNMFLLYFELHLGSFKKPKSLQIFNQVFS
jgi:DNA repair protein RecO (recombination protein O)